MLNYRLACSVCISTKLAQIKPYFKKLSLIDAIIPLNYMVKLGIILIIKFIYEYASIQAINSNNKKYVDLFRILRI
jgi:hypothetical protein